MSGNECFEASAVAEILAMPEDDPRQAHARSCPRCAGLLESYRLFMSPGSALEADHVSRAAAQLEVAIAAMTGLDGARAGAVAASPATPPRATERDHASPSWLDRLLHPSMRPALVFAALAVVLGGVAWWPRLAMTPSPNGSPSVLRGTPGNSELALAHAELGRAGLDLEWAKVSDAEGYVVRVFTPELRELGTLGPMSGTSFHSPLASLPFPIEKGEIVVVQIAAIRSGDTLATSRAQVLQVP